MDAQPIQKRTASVADAPSECLSHGELDEHDLGLVRWMLSLTPIERLRHAEGFAQSAARLRHARRA